ncbi:MAG: HAMP domain-containing protein [Spirochaetes bacterium]|nr:HAMP domain-containing protein [Spirochaetota bacterium]
MISQRLRSLKVAISLIVGGVIVVLTVILSVSSYNTAYNEMRNLYTGQLSNFAKSVMSQIDDLLDNQLKMAKDLAKTSVVREAALTGNVADANLRFKALFDEFGIYENVFIATAERNPLIIASALEKSIGVRWGNAGFDDNISKNLEGQPWVSKPNKSPITGMAVCLVTAPIVADGRVVGIMGIPLNLGEVSNRIVKDITVGKTGYVLVTDGEGVTIAHPKAEYIFKLKFMEHDWGRDLMNAKAGDIVLYTFEGKPKFGAVSISTKYSMRAFATGYESDVSDQARAMVILMFVLAIVCIVAAFVGIYIFIARKLKPLEKCRDLMRDISEGDLTKKYEGTISKDEVGELATATNNMVEKLSAMVRDITESANSFAASAEEISATSENMSQGASEQAANVEEIASSLEEMGATITQNSDNSRFTDEIAQKTSVQAEEGGEAVSGTVDAMGNIAQKISLIEDIAYQTNLLALNAAIEAARAGEHGKGFAVVAGEVRKLAEKSQLASQEIGELAKSSVDIAAKAGKLLDEIVPSIKKTADLVQDITAASEQQDSGVDQINLGMNELNQVTQQNASAAEELASTAEVLSSNALQLQQLVSFFKVTGLSVAAAGGREREMHQIHKSVHTHTQTVHAATAAAAPEAVQTGGNGRKQRAAAAKPAARKEAPAPAPAPAPAQEAQPAPAAKSPGDAELQDFEKF